MSQYKNNDMSIHVQDICLLNFAELEPVSLVGWSDGGITSLVMAVHYPEIINKLVLFGCNAYITEYDVSCIERMYL